MYLHSFYGRNHQQSTLGQDTPFRLQKVNVSYVMQLLIRPDNI